LPAWGTSSGCCDEERRLTPRGEDQSRAAGAALAALELPFQHIYTSPKVRARETARLAAQALGVEPVVLAGLAEGFDAQDARELLQAAGADERVLIVGHNPDFEQVVHDLTGARVDFKKGGIAAIRASRSSGQLLVLMRPKELEALAEALGR
jgi:phosphohistidine phosphatase